MSCSYEYVEENSVFHSFGNKFALDNCEIYPLARQTSLSFPHSSSKTTCSFQLNHMDVWGPYKVETHDRMRYFFYYY